MAAELGGPHSMRIQAARYGTAVDIVVVVGGEAGIAADFVAVVAVAGHTSTREAQPCSQLF